MITADDICTHGSLYPERCSLCRGLHDDEELDTPREMYDHEAKQEELLDLEEEYDPR